METCEPFMQNCQTGKGWAICQVISSLLMLFDLCNHFPNKLILNDKRGSLQMTNPEFRSVEGLFYIIYVKRSVACGTKELIYASQLALHGNHQLSGCQAEKTVLDKSPFIVWLTSVCQTVWCWWSSQNKVVVGFNTVHHGTMPQQWVSTTDKICTIAWPLLPTGAIRERSFALSAWNPSLAEIEQLALFQDRLFF